MTKLIIDKSYVEERIKELDVYSKLCYYDKRNPDNIIDEFDEDCPPQANNKCFCDNCFYGRTKVANTILELLSNSHEVEIPSDDEIEESAYNIQNCLLEYEKEERAVIFGFHFRKGVIEGFKECLKLITK